MKLNWFVKWTWLKALNFFVLQWFFLRIGRLYKSGQCLGFALVFAIPLTGWWFYLGYNPKILKTFRRNKLLKR